MRYLLLALLALANSLAAQPWRVVGDEQFAPYSFVTAEDDTPRGLDVELVDAVLREAQVPYEIRLYPWERVKRMLDRGEVQMAFQFAGTPQRQEQYELVGPLRVGATVFMTTAKTAIKDWKTLDDLSPYVIGQVRGYAYEENFDGADLSRDSSAQNPRQLVSMLLAGRIDIIVGDQAQLLYFIREQRALDQVRVLPRPLIKMPRFVAFSKGDIERARTFSEALVRLRGNGKLDAIQHRWQQ
ncbi:transporter substrate-binding domain-containing protein [Pseudomonas sp. Z8(2022)]|uniref:substrate-binding periplasmic protein n=1 Tax=Pseudomonas sp. Z8(2022) TaxID=2962597 RepID=UPI0021F4E29F|nr:transporter substrate-binding domain-containing protein [Pseudomonas sp. Z8(2022)]UYP29567.1 transporter substrate-binding domain-containing protein [Pseudomonas sp. Z8(2022)]